MYKNYINTTGYKNIKNKFLKIKPLHFTESVKLSSLKLKKSEACDTKTVNTNHLTLDTHPRYHSIVFRHIRGLWRPLGTVTTDFFNNSKTKTNSF